MPKNKFQEVIFTIIMVFFMVYAMICYNISLNIGGMSADYPPLSMTQWFGAIIMVAGIFCIAVNPINMIRKKQED